MTPFLLIGVANGDLTHRAGGLTPEYRGPKRGRSQAASVQFQLHNRASIGYTK